MYFISQEYKLFGKIIFFVSENHCLLLTINAMGDESDTSGENPYYIGLYLLEISV